MIDSAQEEGSLGAGPVAGAGPVVLVVRRRG